MRVSVFAASIPRALYLISTGSTKFSLLLSGRIALYAQKREVIRGSSLHYFITPGFKKRSSVFYIPDYFVNLYASSIFFMANRSNDAKTTIIQHHISARSFQSAYGLFRLGYGHRHCIHRCLQLQLYSYCAPAVLL